MSGEEIMNEEKVYNLDNYLYELKIRLKTSLENARKLIEKAKIKRKI